MEDDKEGAVSAPAEEEPVSLPNSEPEQVEPEAAPEDEPKAEEENEGEESEDGDGDEPTDEDPKPKRSRPGKYQRQLMRSQAEIDALKETVFALTRQIGGPGPSPKVQQQDTTSPRPKQEDFTDYAEFLRADARWEAQGAARQIIQEERQNFQKSQAQKGQEALLSQYNNRRQEAQAEYEDFDEVTDNPDVPITTEMAKAMLGSEVGPKVEYYLCSHPKEAARISRLDAYGQVREIGKLEAKLSAPAPKKTTAAPPPVKPLGGSAAGTAGQTDPSKMTMAQYVKWREAGNG